MSPPLIALFIAAFAFGTTEFVIAGVLPEVAGGLKVIRGVEAVAGQLATFQRMATSTATHPALINGLAGLVNTVDDQVISVMNFTVSDGRIATIDILSDPDRLARLDFTSVEP